MTTIAHISDFHCGSSLFSEKKLKKTVSEVNKLKPDVVIISGDVTNMGFLKEYQLAKKYVDKIKAEKIIIPGNHDARLVGYKYFERFFGKGNTTLKLPGMGIVGLDSTVPDLDEGNIGRGKQRWLTEQLNGISHSFLKIVVLHHHLLPVPQTGRDRSTITDAGTVLETLIDNGADIVLSGHRHTPHSWWINGVAVITAGSISSKKLRADVKNSYNIIQVNSDHIDVHVKEVGGKKSLLAKYNITANQEEYKLKKV